MKKNTKKQPKTTTPKKVNNSNDLLFAFWGITPVAKYDSTVRVWTDPSVLKTSNPKKTTFEDIDDLGEFSSKQSHLGFIRSQQKEERMLHLRQLIDDGEIKTVQEAIKKMPDIHTDKTIIRYLKVIGRELLDERTGNIKGSKVADFSGTPTRKTKKNIPIKYRFFTADPDNSGIELSQDDYIEYRKQLLNEKEEA